MLGSYGVRERYMEARRACSGQPPPASCAICNGNYNLSAGALARDGTKVRDFWWRHKVFCAYVEPGENRTFEINLEPGFFVFQYGPEPHVHSALTPSRC